LQHVAEVVQRAEAAGIQAQHLAIKALGLGEQALLVPVQRPLEQLFSAVAQRVSSPSIPPLQARSAGKNCAGLNGGLDATMIAMP
jgi:hypothetical protein